MKSKLLSLIIALGLLCPVGADAAAPLRVFIRGGKKTHPPGAHEHERFLNDWKILLAERGMKTDGSMEFPTAGQLANTDVLLIHAQNGGDIPDDRRPALDAFLKRGGGLVILHAAAAPEKRPGSAEYLKSIAGGTWAWGQTKWLEGPMSLYYVDRTHPITRDAANFDLDDEIYYDLDLDPSIQVLAAAYTPNQAGALKKDARGQPGKGKVTVYDIAPQMWTYEKTLPGGRPYRAWVGIPGHFYKTFEMPQYRAVLLRGLAWAGRRANVDEYCRPEELAALRYPAGGPSRPEKTLSQMAVHPDFKMSLVAAEPLINKPINIDWDAQGRLWVAETPEYPDGRAVNDRNDLVQRWVPDARVNPQTGLYDRPAYDKISILLDTDGDGAVDRKQIFHEGLERVTSLVLYRDGCIVSQAPDILRLRDTDGDGKADKVEKLYTGLGIRDTHAVINNLRWGFDGWIYATHGYSSTPHLTSGDGSRDFGPIGSGVVRFKPDGSAFEQYSSKGGNTWGLDISWDNEVFWTQPTSGDLLMHVVLSENSLTRGRVPGATSYSIVEKSIPVFPLIAYDQLPYVQIDQVGRFTAAAGTVIYDGGSWPAAWNHRYFTTEPTVNIVHDAVVAPAGVTYTAARAPGRETVEFVAGRDAWFRPIEVRVGPDGAVYVLDFYNQAVIHNDTRGPKHGPRNAAIRPDRDHYYGRIYRIDHQQAKKLPVPNLIKAGAVKLIKALEHPNQHVRMNALRLLAEQSSDGILPAELASLKALATSQKPPQARVAALWALARLGRIDAATLNTAANAENEAVRKNAMMVAAEQSANANAARPAALKLLNDPNPQVRLEALEVLAAASLDPATARALVAVYPKLDDNWSRSAFLGAAAQSPATVLNAALDAGSVNSELVGQLTTLLVNAQNAGEAAKLVVSLAARPAVLDDAKRAALERLAAGLGPQVVPPWNAEIQRALQTLLDSGNAALSVAALPLVVRWDQGGALRASARQKVQQLLAKVGDAAQPDELRGRIAASLLGIRQIDPAIVPTVARILGSSSSASLQGRVLDAFGSLSDAAIGGQIVGAFTKLNGELQVAALNQLLKRASWAMALLDALDAGKIDPQLLGPANVHRLRLHPSVKVAQRANTIMDKLRGPEAKEKAALIAKLTPEVEKAGDAAKGKELFVANCATCHQWGDLGNLAGPPLTGMGAHGPAMLLGHILDPNREVDFSFTAWSIETRDGEIYDGIVTRESRDQVVLRNAAGEKEIPKDTIKSRRNTGRSLMPEGFESLGAAGLRDLLTFICGSESRFRFIDLRAAMTADSRKGIYRSLESAGESLHFVKYGVVNVDGVPFNLVDPARQPLGRNVMVLKGGGGIAKTEMPRKVEAGVGFAAKQLHFLGNVAGWGFPLGGGKVPALKVTAQYAGGATEELQFENGTEFADYIREIDVPGSKLARGLVSGGRQVRLASRKLKGGGIIEKLTFESFDNSLAPTTVAVTADLSDKPLPETSKAAAPVQVASAKPIAVPAPSGPMPWGAGTKVLLVGGGSSHDYGKWFNQADSATLKAAGCTVHYTEDGDVTARELAKVDVAVLSVNRKEWATPALRKALFEFASAGKGLVLLHPGLWYNFNDWPEYNRVLAGGGARGHDKLGEFTVNVLKRDHPVTQGVTPSFKIIDELYYQMPDPEGTPMEVLAETSPSVKFKHPHPSVFIVKHSKARIVGITLGHDARAHELPEYKKLLVNAVKWTADGR